jgi:hypothetical protein
MMHRVPDNLMTATRFSAPLGRGLIAYLLVASLMPVLYAGEPASAISRWETWAEKPAIITVDAQSYASTQAAPMMSASSMMLSPLEPGPLEPYRQGFSSDWTVPEEVDAANPFVRYVLIAPDHPLILDVAIFTNGEAHEKLREDLLHTALDRERASPTDSTADLTRTPAIDKLRQMVAAKQTAPDRQELRWLLAQLVPGPTLLTLNQSYAVKRGRVAPLWQLADSNRDDMLDETELEKLPSLILQADVNRNQILEEQELLAAAGKVTHIAPLFNWPLELVAIDASMLKNRQLASRSFSKPYQSQLAEGSSSYSRWLESKGLKASEPLGVSPFLTLPADLVLQVDFHSDPAHKSTLKLLSTSQSVSSKAFGQTLVIEGDSSLMEISSWTGSSNDWQTKLLGQISVGAALDGFPLFRLLDTDGDRRLSVREQSQVRSVIASLDANKDGRLLPGEAKVPVRLAFATGPMVDDVLNQAVSLQRAGSLESPSASAPEWFVGMDENKDGDLSRSEFLGSDEQFVELDSNKDSLIDVNEALSLSTP